MVKELITATIKQAIHDYVHAKQMLLDNSISDEQRQRAIYTIAETTRFLLSDNLFTNSVDVDCKKLVNLVNLKFGF